MHNMIPYQCTQCQMPFTQASAFKSHRQTHTGGKPYECNKCKVAFAQNGNSKAIKEDTLLPKIVDAVQVLNLKAADDDPSCTKAFDCSQGGEVLGIRSNTVDFTWSFPHDKLASLVTDLRKIVGGE